MTNKLNKLWKCMPLFYIVASDEIFEEDYVFIGFTLLFSILLLPITFPLYLIGLLCRRQFVKQQNEVKNEE